MALRILLASLRAGGGHHACRDSITAALGRADPSGRAFTLLPFDSRNTRVDALYSRVVRRAARLQGLLFSLGDHPLGVDAAFGLNRDLTPEAACALERERPSVVVSTHFLLTLAFARARRRSGWRGTLVSAIPDPGPAIEAFFPRRLADRADHLLVAGEDTRAELLRRGALPARIHRLGFLPREPFSRLGRQCARGRLPVAQRRALLFELCQRHPELAAVDPTAPTLLFLGGSGWTAKAEPLLRRLLARPALAGRLNVVVVAGRDEAFRQRLAEPMRRWPGAVALGYLPADSLAPLMALADTPVLASVAQATLQELLEVGCGPLLVVHHIPGTEGPYLPLLQRERLGCYAPDPDEALRLALQTVGLAPAQPWLSRLAAGFHAEAARVRSEERGHARRLVELFASFSRRGEAPWELPGGAAA